MIQNVGYISIISDHSYLHLGAYGRVAYAFQQTARVLSAMRYVRVRCTVPSLTALSRAAILRSRSSRYVLCPPKAIALPLVLADEVDLCRSDITAEIHADRRVNQFPPLPGDFTSLNTLLLQIREILRHLAGNFWLKGRLN
jgi:hypothetical protein